MNKSYLILSLKLISDVIIINISFIVGYLIKFGMINVLALPVFHYLKVLAFISLLWLIIFNLAGLYKLQGERTGRVDSIFSVSFGIFSAAFFTYLVIVYFYREAFYSRAIVIYASLLAMVLINLSRYFIWKLHE